MLTSNVDHQNQCWHEATKIAIYNVEDCGKETTVLIMLDKELLLFFLKEMEILKNRISEIREEVIWSFNGSFVDWNYKYFPTSLGFSA